MPRSQLIPPFALYFDPAERSRIGHVLAKHFPGQFLDISDARKHTLLQSGADFSWIHVRNDENEALCSAAKVCSQLAHISIFEDKSNLALLQTRMGTPCLTTHILHGAIHVRSWWVRHIAQSSNEAKRTWILKDAQENGGAGIWICNACNWSTVAALVEQHETDSMATAQAGREGHKAPTPVYVLQQYIEKPMLWKGGYKFHFRVYAILKGDLRMFVYKRAFAHVANKRYDTGDLKEASAMQGMRATGTSSFDPEIHLTNVSVNIHGDGFHCYPQVLPFDTSFVDRTFHSRPLGIKFAPSRTRPPPHPLTTHLSVHTGAAGHGIPLPAHADDGYASTACYSRHSFPAVPDIASPLCTSWDRFLG
jgi:hypothetical protein